MRISDAAKSREQRVSSSSPETTQKARDNVSQITDLMSTVDDEFGSPGDDFTATRDGFAGLYQSLQEAGQQPESNGALHPPGHPDVDLMPNGDVFGSYKALGDYLKPQGLSSKRGAEVMGFEKHHLIEDHWMEHFGFSQGETPCVVLYADEHMQLVHGEEGIPEDLSRVAKSREGTVRGVAYDIEALVEGHTAAYQKMGRPEWAERLRSYVRDNRGRIIKAYEDGTVPWATPEDAARARKYLQEM